MKCAKSAVGNDLQTTGVTGLQSSRPLSEHALHCSTLTSDMSGYMSCERQGERGDILTSDRGRACFFSSWGVSESFGRFSGWELGVGGDGAADRGRPCANQN